jgi:sulfatase maturation enzyme AslB (radical SAM superfamily)
MNISLAPSFHCNFRCSWCYLSVEQLRNKSLIDLSLLDSRLIEAGPIEHVDIYGGEPGTLPSHFAIELVDLLKKHTASINVISNFSVIPDWFHRTDITVSASYDWVFREQYDKVLTNIIGFSKPIPILMLATDKLCKIQPKEIAQVLNNIRTIGSLEIKPYSQNQFNQYKMDWTVFEEWIKEWIKLDLNFHLVNKDILDNSKNKLYNAYSDNHLYVGPDSNFSVLDFDLNDLEYFRPIKDIADYKKWVAKEVQMVQSNKFCKDCRWQGHCATEHYRNVTTLEYSCNGFKNLLDWYDKLEN